MGILYLAALIIGGGTLAVQLVLGHDADADADADLDADGDVHADGGHGDGGFAAVVLSLRFWTFGLLSFGLVGTLLHYLHLAGSLATPVLAVAMGLASGFFAAWVLATLMRTATSSGAESSDAVGHVGKVLLPLSRDSRGKVRVEIKGQSVDYMATTEEDEDSRGRRRRARGGGGGQRGARVPGPRAVPAAEGLSERKSAITPAKRRARVEVSPRSLVPYPARHHAGE